MKRCVPRQTLLAIAAAFWTATAMGQTETARPMRAMLGVMAPMRDGVQLAADIWLPAAPGRYPVLIARSPYLKTNYALPEWGKYFAARGYVFISQDTRGRGDSEGKFSFFAADGKDGYDTIEWAATQPWSNGRVGTLSLSYLGTVQWLAARERPPHLTCMAPTAAAGRWFEEIPYMGGAFSLAFALNWVNIVSGRMFQDGTSSSLNWEAINHRPLLTADSVLGRKMPIYREWLQHGTLDAHWARLQYTEKDFASITIPTLTTTGWFDGDQPGALFYWNGLMEHAPDKSRHFLVAGPWRHLETFAGGSTKVGELEFTKESVLDMKAVHLAFFDWCLKSTSPKFEAPRAKVYVTGANEWRSYDSYPPAGSKAQLMHLSSGGRANSSSGDGTLSWQAAEGPPDSFVYDPKNAVPALAGEYAGDRSRVQQRQDVLVYTGEVLSEPLEVIGKVFVDLKAATDARDTDFTAVLTDLGPDGRAIRLGAFIGIRRGRFRNGYTREELLTPGKVENYRIELFDVAHRFLPGHRVRLEISSSATPEYNPNQNTGNPVATDTVWRVAKQTIHHDRTNRSTLSLPVMSRRETP